MQSFKLMCLKTAIILTFVAGLVIAMGNAKYLWLLLLLIPSFLSLPDFIIINLISHK